MINLIQFKEWLCEHTTYSKPVVSDIASRVKRANSILPLDNDEMYQYKLEHLYEYQCLSVSVRSQIKKAVKLYKEYEKMSSDENVK